MITVNFSEAQTNLANLAELIGKGEEILVTGNNNYPDFKMVAAGNLKQAASAQELSKKLHALYEKMPKMSREEILIDIHADRK